MLRHFSTNTKLAFVGLLAVASTLSACEVSDYFLPNPDDSVLYTDPYIGLKQLNAAEGRRISQERVESLRGQLTATGQQLQAFSGKLAPAAASVVLEPPRDILNLTDDDLKFAVLDDRRMEALTKRQLNADLELGFYREARVRAEQHAAQLAQAEAARQEAQQRIADLNAQLENAELLPRREVEARPQPQPPTSLQDLVSTEEGEVPLGIVYFESGSAELGPREEVVIRTIARRLAPRGLQINVRGFDAGSLANRTRADRARSLAVSQRRANAVRDLLVQEGYPSELITTNAFGDSDPTFPENSEFGVFANQRVEITAVQDGSISVSR